MTDLAPAPHQTFGGRTAALERAAAPSQGIAARDLQEQFKVATAIAGAKDAVPPSYRNNPGAALLALGWAAQHQVDVLTAIQNISFISGKAVVEATMQRALATRDGITVKIPHADTESATVELHRGDQLLGSATYTIGEAKTAGLANKDNWKKNPGDMLVARATTRAVRRFAPGVLLGMVTTDEVEDGAALEDLVADGPTPALNQLAPPADEPPAAAAGVHDAEVVDEQPAEPAPSDGAPPAPEAIAFFADRDTLVERLAAHGIKRVDLIREAASIAADLGCEAPSVVTKIADAPPPLQLALYAWIQTEGQS